MARIYDETIVNDFSFLQNFATGYTLSAPVADFIAPPFQVKQETGKYLEYDKTQFRIWDDKISGEEEAREIQWDVDESTYACEEYGMAKFVSDKKAAQAISVINLKTDTVKMLKQFHALAREYRVNAIAGSAAVVTQTAAIASAWNTAAGVPLTNITTALRQIANSTGGLPANRIVLSYDVALAMIRTTEWLTQFVNTDTGFANGLWSAIAGLRHLGLEPMITSIQGLSEYKCTTSDPTTEAIWDDNVLIFRAEPVSMNARSFMYSPFVKKDVVFETREPRRRGVTIDIYSDIDELLIDASCAYLLTNCV